MRHNILDRLLNVTRKQIKHLLGQCAQINSQIQQLDEVLSQLNTEYHRERRFFFDNMASTEKQSAPIYDCTPYLEQIVIRQQQVKKSITLCQEVLQQMKTQLLYQHQQEQQYRTLLARHQKEQNLAAEKNSQQLADEYAHRG